MHTRTYIAIDLKSFYASVECADRQLDALTTNLVMADQSRMEKTICLAVSPSLKACGIPGRPRLFEVVQKVRQVNAQRQRLAPQRRFTGKTANAPELAANHEPLMLRDSSVIPSQWVKHAEPLIGPDFSGKRLANGLKYENHNHS